MKQIIDDSGNLLKGLFRSKSGLIVVDDREAYNKYKRDKDLETRLIHQEHEINQMKLMLESILNKLNEIK